MSENTIFLKDWADAFGFNGEVPAAAEGCSRTAEQESCLENGLEYLKNSQMQIMEAILTAVFREYPQWREEYIYDSEYQQEQMPEIEQKKELLKLIMPKQIHLLNVQKENLPYFGVEFTCTWDEEQGLGVMMYKDRVISVGEGAEACRRWIAENDRDSKEFEEIKSQKKMACNIRF